MTAGVKTMIDLGLQAQVARLRHIVEDYKERAIDEVKQTVISIGIRVALALVGLMFVLIALLVGLAALYLWVAQQYGPFEGLAAVGGLAILVALVSLSVMAFWGGSSSDKPSAPKRHFAADHATSDTQSPIAGAMRSALSATDEVTDKARDTIDSVEQASAAAREAIDDAVEAIRNGSRPALFATIAGTVILGFILARRQ